MPPLYRWPAWGRQLLNATVIVGSVVLCLMALPLRLPGMTLLGIGPNWLLVWVVAWSVKRSIWHGAIAGLTLGLLQDSMSAAAPTHAVSLVLVGVLTARLQKQRFIQEDFISVALIVFGMAVVAETIVAVQFSIHSLRTPDSEAFLSLTEVWSHHQRVALASAILSSLWAPVAYFPLNHWWERMTFLEQRQAGGELR